jgi:hypothetical protein
VLALVLALASASALALAALALALALALVAAHFPHRVGVLELELKKRLLNPMPLLQSFLVDIAICMLGFLQLV